MIRAIPACRYSQAGVIRFGLLHLFEQNIDNVVHGDQSDQVVVVYHQNAFDAVLCHQPRYMTYRQALADRQGGLGTGIIDIQQIDIATFGYNRLHNMV